VKSDPNRCCFCPAAAATVTVTYMVAAVCCCHSYTSETFIIAVSATPFEYDPLSVYMPVGCCYMPYAYALLFIHTLYRCRLPQNPLTKNPRIQGGCYVLYHIVVRALSNIVMQCHMPAAVTYSVQPAAAAAGATLPTFRCQTNQPYAMLADMYTVTPMFRYWHQ